MPYASLWTGQLNPEGIAALAACVGDLPFMPNLSALGKKAVTKRLNIFADN
jgi:hypothetical protein